VTKKTLDPASLAACAARIGSVTAESARVPEVSSARLTLREPINRVIVTLQN